MFRSSDEVLHILGNILGSLQRGRTSLIVPRKKTIDDLIKSRNMVSWNYFFSVWFCGECDILLINKDHCELYIKWKVALIKGW